MAAVITLAAPSTSLATGLVASALVPVFAVTGL
jgi:hypothetical protein